MSLGYDARKVEALIRTIAVSSKCDVIYAAEVVKQAKDNQRKNQQEYENLVSCLLFCLENFDVVEGGTAEVKCALVTLATLLQLDLTANQVSQCNSYLSICLTHVQDVSVAFVASRAFGETLVTSMTSDFVQEQVEGAFLAIDLKENITHAQRVCALLMLQEVVTKIPMRILDMLDSLFEKLWGMLASSDAMIREISHLLFMDCGKLLCSRSPVNRKKTVDSLLHQLKFNLAAKSRESNMAGLLAFETVVMTSVGTASQPRYEDMSIMLVPYVMTGGSTNIAELRELLFRCLIVLCRYSTTLFITNQLKDTVGFALKSIENGYQVAASFNMLSEIIVLVTDVAFRPFVNETCNAVRYVSGKSSKPCWEAVRCFSVICHVCPPVDVESYIEPCIENIFRWGLSLPLIESMPHIIASSSAKYRSRLEEGLLDMISVTLCGLPFRQQPGSKGTITMKVESEPTESQITVALDALVQFGFSDSELMGDFLRDSVLPLIDSESVSVRTAAVRTICTLLIPPGVKGELTMARRICVDVILSRMLVVGLSNPDPVVRKGILSSFTEPFYPFLKEVQFVTSIYAALGDEDISCRVAATVLLCRMTFHDPSHILPIFRKQIVQILHTVSTSDNTGAVQSGLQLLDAAASNAPQFVMNFADGIIKALGHHFSTVNIHSSILQHLLRCCTSVAHAAHFFGNTDAIFRVEVDRAYMLLKALPLDSESVELRLWCLRFLSATLGPQIEGRSPYEVYPHLYQQLSGIVKNNDEDLNVRLEALRCAGVIGALDISIFHSTVVNRTCRHEEMKRNEPSTLSHAMCCRVVIRSIASLLDLSEKRFSGGKDNVLRVGIQTILNIAESCPDSRGEIAVVIPPVVRAVSELSACRLLGTLLHELTQIIRYVGVAALSHAHLLYNLIDESWVKSSKYRFLAVRLALTLVTLEADGKAESRRSNMRMSPIKFDALNDIESSESLRYAIIEYILKHTQTLKTCVETVVTNLLRAAQRCPIDFALSVITTLRVVCFRLHVDEFAGLIVRGLLSCLKTRLSTSMRATEQNAFVSRIMSVFCVLMTVLQSEFVKYSSEVLRTLKTLRVSNNELITLHGTLMKGGVCTLSKGFVTEHQKQVVRLLKECEGIALRHVSDLDKVLSTRGNVDEKGWNSDDGERPLPFSEKLIISTTRTAPLTKEEWLRWLNDFSCVIMQESPYRVFRCISLPLTANTSPLVDCSPQFTQDIAPHAFRALWNFASASVRSSLADFFFQVLQQAMESSAVPDEVVSALLTVAEYMDNVGMALPIAPSILSRCAWGRGMLAKALYWCEAAYRKDPRGTAKYLFSLYRELQQSGLLMVTGHSESLKLLQGCIDNERSESDGSDEYSVKWLSRQESLRRMCGVGGRSRSDANSSFNGEDVKLDPEMENEVNTLYALSEAGDYDAVLEQWKVLFQKYNGRDEQKREENTLFYVSQCAADASIRLQAWDTLEDTTRWQLNDTVSYHVSRAALSIHKRRYEEATSAINEGRKLLLEDLSGLLHQSYTRAYEGLVIAQKLSELEEIVTVKRAEVVSSTHHLSRVLRLWSQRIEMMSSTVSAWKEVLGVRGLLIPPGEDVATRLRFVNLCRREKAKQHERFILCQLLGYRCPTSEQLMHSNANPRVVMQYISFLSANGELGPKSSYGLERDLLKRMIDTHSRNENAFLLSSAYARLGSSAELSEAVQCYKAATTYCPKWFHAWRMFAESNAEMLDVTFSDATCAAAIEGYIQSIKLGNSDSTIIQDVLKLLTLLSRHCDQESGLKELRKRVFEVSPRAWKLVVPQLIARLDSGSDGSCELVAEILTTVSFDCPLSLIYPLNLCAMSNSRRRRKYANIILDKLQSKHPLVVNQGRILVDELVRTSDLLHEQWYHMLECSATAFFDRNDYKGMLDVLLPLHEKLHLSTDTIVEAEFTCKFGNKLDRAQEWLQSYLRTGSIADLHSAWNIYHAVYQQIDKQIRSQSKLHLSFCSPKLFEARNLAVGLPDAMPSEDCAVRCIASFNGTLTVIGSKQRPKRLSVTTVDGEAQKYLLKGREDLRLDERVMQLFRLVNTLMMTDSRTCKNPGFQIQRYSVTPLKDTVGLIGWVSGCDTLHTLVTKYRKFRGIPPELELRMMNQIIVCDRPKTYDHLTMISKVEVMEFLADHTSGHDVRKAMWASASNCEMWLEQRQVFTTSSATTCMVGYILGLGDRHPNNVMIQRTSGLFVHIDFGDCFEVAMTRQMFPERVPFRLTRMIRNALDVFGVDGPFRSIAETAMCVLRDGSRSVLAILEAFIQDPLISWRLLNHMKKEPGDSTVHKNIDEQSEAVGPRMSSVAFPGAPVRDDMFTVDSKLTRCASIPDDDVVHKGVKVFQRVRSKLKGEEFLRTKGDTKSTDPKVQVARLIVEATDITNVAQSWAGWYPFW
ncbi:phosphatidylinositol 3-kinase tor, putative [Trypanosoma brucei gambiense DAL972]|uniref:Serine/threonine-protein kinase TOR n=1 Tax=Trypanosoma brucei gambiense (strain MHOM/CI/86/DAL972) TaxID=679716 RepID=C9ZLN5_TRYB9|nr:phosphatidylinositol 3-kinase tor, putative [Trypanosoma brucei gambiense DAL972]CBH10310.1 phosphatidylinositol 3-kinase tor, putative [Trypanosoma brucei gambiense DAL972]|eukprot:XP_011772600.1 phosphatidylinositol 3-kinase tor, putative [Trypanosoma brucei gambiense DAL972]